MKELIIRNRWLYIPFLIALALGVILLLVMDKGEGVLLANGNNSPFLDQFMKYYTHTGDGLFFATVILALFFIKVRYGFTALLGFGIASGGAQLLKQIVFTDRYRPKGYFESEDILHQVPGVDLHLLNSFPSGHSTTAFAMFTFLGLLIAKPNWLKAIFMLMAVVTGLSRMYLGQHFLEDVVAGGALGTVVMSIVFYLFIAKEKPLLNKKWLEYSIFKK